MLTYARPWDLSNMSDIWSDSTLAPLWGTQTEFQPRASPWTSPTYWLTFGKGHIRWKTFQMLKIYFKCFKNLKLFKKASLITLCTHDQVSPTVTTPSSSQCSGFFWLLLFLPFNVLCLLSAWFSSFSPCFLSILLSSVAGKMLRLRKVIRKYLSNGNRIKEHRRRHIMNRSKVRHFCVPLDIG